MLGEIDGDDQAQEVELANLRVEPTTPAARGFTSSIAKHKRQSHHNQRQQVYNVIVSFCRDIYTLFSCTTAISSHLRS